MHRRLTHLLVAVALVPLVLAAAGPDPSTTSLDPTSPAGLAEMPPPVDPQSWELPGWMTWEDYNPIPGVDWNDPSHQPPKKIRAALVLGDFQDREFVVTQPEGSDLLGLDGDHNPMGVGDVPRDEVAEFYRDFLVTEPSALNHGHTINEFWLEDSYGLVGVDAEAFGPYRMDGKEHEYGLGDVGGGTEQCPAGDTCGQDFDSELINKSAADVAAGMAANGEDYDFRYLLHAGYDESGVWQEFGEMLFPSRDEVSEPFGNPDPDQPNWVETRYIDWTSFAAGKAIWSHALPGTYSTQGESDGAATYAHELSHIFGVLDNYNNPYGDSRSYTGPWAQLSRGTFNGPGGPHSRWQIPANLGGSMGSHHMLRNKLRLGFMKPNEVLFLERNALAATGPVFATIYPRAYPLAPVTDDVGLHGLHVTLDEDRSSCDANDYTCDGGGYTSYTLEVVDRIGYDSFTPDSGVLLAKNKDAVDLAPFMWAIDAHTENINTKTGVGEHAGREIYDFVRPGTGEKVPIAEGDYRQLADALFHAGTGPGVVDEYVDEANRLHFYVLGTGVDAQGVRTYRVAVRSLDGGGPFPRGVEATATSSEATAAPGRVAVAHVSVTNTGLATDLLRLAPAVDAGWTTRVSHDVIEVAAGETVDVPVHVAVPQDARTPATLTLTATSETDPTATASAEVTVRPLSAGGGPSFGHH